MASTPVATMRLMTSQRPALGNVATYNIHHGAPPTLMAARPGWLRAVRGLDADILAVQEVDRFNPRSGFVDQVRLIARATGLCPVFARTRRMFGVGQYGHALLCREAPSAVELVKLPEFGGERRLAILAALRLAGAPISVAAVHLHNEPRVASAQLEVVVERLLRRPGPHLLIGDLNLGPGRIGGRLQQAGLSAVGSPHTFPSWEPKRQIDWIVGSGLDVGPVWVGAAATSDHLPLLAEVRKHDASDVPSDLLGGP